MTDEQHDDFGFDDAEGRDGRDAHEERSEDERRHDERLDAIVRGLAMDYHRPPATPRDAMWQAIAAGVNAKPAPTVHEFRIKRYATIATYALAASLLVAAGVGIGKSVERRASSVEKSRAVATLDTPRSAAGASSAERGARSVDSAAQSEAPSIATRAPSAGSTLDARRSTLHSSRVESRGDPSSSTYQQLTTQHLAQVEALLTSFRSDEVDGSAARTPAQARTDAQLTAWARNLLTDTRLLLDAPAERVAERGSARRRLLEDLELVLVQIVQLSPGTATDDRLLIERTMSREHVMPRLRAANPAGQTSGT